MQRRLDMTHIYIVVTWPWYAHHGATRSEECNLQELLVAKTFASVSCGQIWSWNRDDLCKSSVMTVKETYLYQKICFSVLFHDREFSTDNVRVPARAPFSSYTRRALQDQGHRYMYSHTHSLSTLSLIVTIYGWKLWSTKALLFLR